MAKNNLLRFATSPDANVMTDEELINSSELLTGFVARSKASSSLIGKLLQNANAGSNAVGEYIVKRSDVDVSANDAELGTKLEDAIEAHINASSPRQDLTPYLKIADATNTYLSKVDAEATYAKSTEMTTQLQTRAPITNPVFQGTVTGAFKGDLTGTASTANQTTATLTLQTNGGGAVTFNGSANQTFNVTPAAIGALPTSGGTLTGDLTVNGALKGATLTATSDIRLKEHVERIDRLNSLLTFTHPCTYNFKGSEKRHIGLIAQDVQMVYPEAVEIDESGYLAIDYPAITALLVGDVNYLKEELRRVQDNIVLLTAKIADLEAQQK